MLRGRKEGRRESLFVVARLAGPAIFPIGELTGVRVRVTVDASSKLLDVDFARSAARSYRWGGAVAACAGNNCVFAAQRKMCFAVVEATGFSFFPS